MVLPWLAIPTLRLFIRYFVVFNGFTLALECKFEEQILRETSRETNAHGDSYADVETAFSL